MDARAPFGKRRWAAAGVAAVALALLVAALFRAPAPALSHSPGATPIVILAAPDTLLKDETALHDPAPLFLPTQWNSRPEVRLGEPGGSFAAYPAEFHFDADALRIPLPNDVPARPADALTGNPPGNMLLGIGRTDDRVPILASRGAFLEIVAAGTGAPVFSSPLAGASPPQAAFWRPLEFTAAVDAAGLVGPLVLSVGSDVEAVDAYFGRYLVQTFQVGKRLAPGFYRIRVGP